MKIIARLDNWTECYLEVLGIGDAYIFGRIVEEENDTIIRDEGLFEKDQPWIFSVKED